MVDGKKRGDIKETEKGRKEKKKTRPDFPHLLTLLLFLFSRVVFCELYYFLFILIIAIIMTICLFLDPSDDVLPPVLVSSSVLYLISVAVQQRPTRCYLLPIV
ncbi:hypothetical protein P168DRAFT_53124 [Aspergillus campestris IBT 28561]|uniref:Uncharacterized protein n=1 Tax=Aspergillus campestris (strain IBT 28561) TaxID=1392248 RepID=A0A2I1CVF6_ASPC2|nr:uncharacterized protein P168DRAFT_53124 [Aspergillus campestris IBT 28561]PKY01617.1 hypothetical protein P168DRAFT_53124 [Aspergillus campestris IBT 28561]